MSRFPIPVVRRVALRAALIFTALALVASVAAVATSHTLASSKPVIHAAAQVAAIDPTCTSPNPCIEYDNNGTGSGIRGVSVNGNGLGGQTKKISTSTVTGREGVLGNDLSTSGKFNAGVRGLSVRGTGVAGQSTSGPGVVGTSSSGLGMEASSTNDYGLFGSTGCSCAAGVLGSASSGLGVLGASDSNVGVYGVSTSGEGVFGQTTNTSSGVGTAGVFGIDFGLNPLDDGVFGLSNRNIGVGGATSTGTAVAAVASGSGVAINASATTGNGLHVFNEGTAADDADFLTSSIGGEAFIGVSNGLGVMASGFASSSSNVPALSASCGGAPAIIATHRGVGDVMSLDCSGNMIIRGGLTTSGTPLVARRNSAGGEVGTFSSQQTAPTMEDVGEAQLVNGQAYVRLAPDLWQRSIGRRTT